MFRRFLPMLFAIPWSGHAQVSLEAARDAANAALTGGHTLVVDIREADEHAAGVAKGAKLIPMSVLSSRLAEIPKDLSRPVLLICNTQNRSSTVAKALQSRGYTNVQFVYGGMSEWNRRGWATEKTK